jgi:hypothetical protein
MLCFKLIPDFVASPASAKAAMQASTMSTNSSSSSNFQELPVAQIQAASTQSAKMDLDGTDSPWGGKYMMRVDKKIGCRG